MKGIFKLIKVVMSTAAILAIILSFFYLNTFALERPSRVDVDAIRQTWLPWGKETLGFSNSIIEERGCALLCASMVMNYYGANTNPSNLNVWLKENGGFQGASMIWSALPKLVSGVSYVGNVRFSAGVDFARINSELDNGYPVIVEINTQKIGTHFVVITGYEGNDYIINDSSFENTGIKMSQLHGEPSQIIRAIVMFHGPTRPRVPAISYKSLHEDRQSIVVSSLEIPDIKLRINENSIEVNTYKKDIPVAPKIIQGRTYIPLRSIIEEVGGKVEWNADDHKITITLDDRIVEAWINKKGIYINGWLFELDNLAIVDEDRAMIPLRGIFGLIGFKIDWNPLTQEISISSASGIASPNIVPVYTEPLSPKEVVKNIVEMEEAKRFTAIPNYLSKQGKINLGRKFEKAIIGNEYLSLKENNENIRISYKESIDGTNGFVGIILTDGNGKNISTPDNKKLAVKLVEVEGLWYVEDKGEWYFPK